MSTRLTLKRGLEAVAITVMRYLSSAGETARPSFCQGWPVGTKTTSSRLKMCATSLPATRCPWWTGSKVPPITPIRLRPLGLLTGCLLIITAGNAKRDIARISAEPCRAVSRGTTMRV